MILGLWLFSCGEKEEPATVFGEYLPQSITSDKAMDITGGGVVSVDLLEQLENNSRFSGKIFLNLYSPEYFNLHFSQVLLRLPFHFEFENKVNIEYYQNGRRFDLEENGNFSLSWNTYPTQFEFPEQIHADMVIESFKINPKKNRTVELLVAQKWFDHSNNDWVEAKISYTFLKVN